MKTYWAKSVKILGIDTSTNFLSIGIYGDNNVYEYNLELGRKHSSLLILTIKRILEALGWDAGDIDYFVCGLGPGSFTGIRVGLATIKGLAWSLNKPTVGIPTLDILASGVDVPGRPIVPVIDAKRGLVYCSIYKIKDNIQKRVAPYMLLAEDDFFRKVNNGAVIFGDAAPLYKEKILNNIKGATVLDKGSWYPKGRNIINLALERIKQKKADNAFDLRPVYLYPKECQIKSKNE